MKVETLEEHITALRISLADLLAELQAEESSQVAAVEAMIVLCHDMQRTFCQPGNGA